MNVIENHLLIAKHCLQAAQRDVMDAETFINNGEYKQITYIIIIKLYILIINKW